jgi:hypothetical protein
MGFKKRIFYSFLLLVSVNANAQKIEKVFFNLYTDSLKLNQFNYINIDAKLSNGSYKPLTSNELHLSSNTGNWNGNSLYVDSSYKKDSVVISYTLKDNKLIEGSITIYIKKVEVQEKLKTEKEYLGELKRKNLF